MSLVGDVDFIVEADSDFLVEPPKGRVLVSVVGGAWDVALDTVSEELIICGGGVLAHVMNDSVHELSVCHLMKDVV